MSIAYYNGKFTSIDKARIPLTDRAIFFGDGVYDAAIGKNGKIYMQSEHVARFFKNAAAMGIPISESQETFTALLHNCVKLSGEDVFFLYFQATRFSKERVHAYGEKVGANILITVTKINEPTPDRTLTLSFFEDKRYSYCNVKTLNLLPSVLASTDALHRGFDEAIFLRGKTVTECAHSNVSIIKGEQLYTHPESTAILSGTARAKMIEAAISLGAVCREIPFSKDELLSADEVLVSSSTKLCARASRVEDKFFEQKKDSLGAKICKIMYNDFINSTKMG